MYETYDAKTGELVRKDLDETQRGLESGELVSVFEEPEQLVPKVVVNKIKPATPKAVDDENQG